MAFCCCGGRADASAELVVRHDFDAVFAMGKQLGEGAYSVVYECRNRRNDDVFAAKVIKKEGLAEDERDDILAEVRMLSHLHHKNVMGLEDVFEDDDRYILVSECYSGGELIDRIMERDFFSEREARETVRTLLQAIAYCHSRQVVHRDLKLQNVLLKSRRADSDIVIVDFGFAKRLGREAFVTGSGEGGEGGGVGQRGRVEFRDRRASTVCGSPAYVAPEILDEARYGKGVDVWSVGVMAHALLCGGLPFMSESGDQDELFELIQGGELPMEQEQWGQVSPAAKAAVRAMLTRDAEARPGAAELRKARA